MIGTVGLSIGSKLAEVYERLNAMTGAGLRSPTGPSAEPSESIVRAFREALESAETSGNNLQVQNSESGNFLSAESDAHNSEPSPSAPEGRLETESLQTDAIGRPLPGAQPKYQINAPGMHFTPELSSPIDVQNMGMQTGPEIRTWNTSSIADNKEPLTTNGIHQNENTASNPAENNSELIKELEDVLDAIFNKGSMGHTELYKLQMLTGVLRAHASAGNKATQHMQEGFDQLLRQSG